MEEEAEGSVTYWKAQVQNYHRRNQITERSKPSIRGNQSQQVKAKPAGHFTHLSNTCRYSTYFQPMQYSIMFLYKPLVLLLIGQYFYFY